MTLPAVTANWEFFRKDPRGFVLLNDGVAKIRSFGPDATEHDWNALRYELETFVCEGEYHAGLQRILSTFLANIDQPTQPAVWVSGWFGSGKSHFIRVLEALWRDVPFPDGESARSKVSLPDDIQELLHELTTEGRRAGGLWSASGMAVENRDQTFAMMLLGTIFEAAGLARDYGQARFHLWLRREGWEGAIRRRLEAAGRDFRKELDNYLVSTPLAEAIRACNPALGSSEDDVLDRIAGQFPSNRTALGMDEFKTAVDDVLASVSEKPGRRPLTLIVLDEMQQYIGDDAGRSKEVQEVVELLSSSFAGSAVFVGTGQLALHGTPNLQKLRDRFTTRVTLSDADVEQVVRKVVLAKRQDRKGELEDLLDQAAGEIDRQLRETRVGPVPEDRRDLVNDYPLLPVRRRLWENMLKAIDPSGTSGQLRNQLRVTLEATRSVADKPAGYVIPGDHLYEQLSAPMAQAGVLPREVLLFIQRLNDGTDDGRLRSRLCGLIFLISSLPRADLLVDLGVRATAETLADLVVDDLTVATPELRGRIPALLQELTDTGQLLRSPSGEYSIQTGESLQWEKVFQHHAGAIAGVLPKIGEARDSALRKLVETEVKKLKRTQGVSAVPRDVKTSYGPEAPPPSQTAVAIWVRDGWTTAPSAVLEDARQLGPTNPTILVHLPQRSPNELTTAIVRADAATMTLHERGTPSTDVGRAAQAHMQNRAASETDARDRILAEVIANARVFQGGGTEVEGTTLAQMLQTAFEASLKRMYPDFPMADNPKWDTVFTRAKGGGGDALTAVGDHGEALDNPIVKRVQTFIGGEPGKSWAETRAHFAKAPFGWPQGAVDGSVALLTLLGAVKALKDGKPVKAGDLGLQQVAQIRLIGESTPILKSELLAVRGLMNGLGTAAKDDDEVRAKAGAFIAGLITRAKSSGGLAPAPLVTVPAYLTELESLSGTQQLKALFEHKDQIAADAKAWDHKREQLESRLPRWQELKRLESHAAGLPGLDDTRAEIAAIENERRLLDEPNPIPALEQRLTAALRAAWNKAHEDLDNAFASATAALVGTREWGAITAPQQEEIATWVGLRPPSPPPVATTADLLAALQTEPLPSLRDRIEAIPARFEKAHAEAARLLEPEVVTVQIEKPMLRSEPELDAWLSRTRDQLAATIRAGNPAKVV